MDTVYVKTSEHNFSDGVAEESHCRQQLLVWNPRNASLEIISKQEEALQKATIDKTQRVINDGHHDPVVNNHTNTLEFSKHCVSCCEFSYDRFDFFFLCYEEVVTKSNPSLLPNRSCEHEGSFK